MLSNICFLIKIGKCAFLDFEVSECLHTLFLAVPIPLMSFGSNPSALFGIFCHNADTTT